jgi:hypothetical protein
LLILENLPTDKLHKFLACLGIVLIVTVYKIGENKSEKVIALIETLYHKSDTLVDIIQREYLLINATSENKNRLYKRDSLKFSEVIKNKKAEELLAFYKHNQEVIDRIYASMDSSTLVNAKIEATIKSKEREISTLQEDLNFKKSGLNNWRSISLYLNILGLIFFIFGIWIWFLTDTTPEVSKKHKEK